MSMLIDRLIYSDYFKTNMANVDGGWYVAKPLNYSRPHSSIRRRVRDAWRVMVCRAIAVHFKQEEL